MSVLSKVSSLKPGTRKLMNVLKRIKNVQTGPKRRISLKPESFGEHQSGGYINRLVSRLKLSQSHKQVKRIGKGKGYREYLKRMK